VIKPCFGPSNHAQKQQHHALLSFLPPGHSYLSLGNRFLRVWGYTFLFAPLCSPTWPCMEGWDVYVYYVVITFFLVLRFARHHPHGSPFARGNSDWSSQHSRLCLHHVCARLEKIHPKKIYSCGVCVCVGLKAHKVQYQGMFPVDLYYPLLLRHRAILLSYTITFSFSIRNRHYSIQKLPKSSNEKNKNVKSQKKKKCSSLRLKCARAPVLQPSPTHFIHFPPFVLSYLCLCDPPCRVGILVQAKLSSCAWTSPYLRLVIFPSTYTHFFKFSHKKMRCFLCRQRKW